jgi:O-antigen ligase
MSIARSKKTIKPPVVPKIARRECLVASCGAVTLAFTAWGLAGYKIWSLHTILAGALLTFAFAIVPLPSVYNGLDGEHGNGKNFKRLLCLPAFWFSLIFLFYLALQGLNPDAQVIYKEGSRWLRQIDPPFGNSWPVSVRAFYNEINSWRVMLVFLSGFSLFWGMWVGLRRRKTVIAVLWSFLLSGSSMALVAILMHLTEAKLLLWVAPSNNQNFWGSFAYRNHGAAYLNLILVATGFLFFYHLQKAQNRRQVGGPHLLLFCLFAMVMSSVVMALSRGGILFGVCISVAFFCLSIIYGLRTVFNQRSIWLSLLPVLLLGSAALIAFQQVDLDAISKRFGNIEATVENADSDARVLSSRATWDMAQERLVFGWGAGSFRYRFHPYQKEYPEIYYSSYHAKKGWIGRKTYHYAHNDILQFLAEYGIVGCSFLLLTLASFLWVTLRAVGSNTLSVVMLLVGVIATFSHAFLDFILSAPAYLIALIGFYAAAAKLLRLETRRRKV